MTSVHEREYGYDWLMQRSTKAQTTLGDLHRATPWVWVYCEKCPHQAPLACAVSVIRCGADTSSDNYASARAAPPAATRVQRFSILAGAALKAGK
jgi:hypothetical protein